jgi:hypothetical protein
LNQTLQLANWKQSFSFNALFVTIITQALINAKKHFHNNLLL